MLEIEAAEAEAEAEAEENRWPSGGARHAPGSHGEGGKGGGGQVGCSRGGWEGRGPAQP
jgi:hypothetical protein